MAAHLHPGRLQPHAARYRRVGRERVRDVGREHGGVPRAEERRRRELRARVLAAASRVYPRQSESTQRRTAEGTDREGQCVRRLTAPGSGECWYRLGCSMIGSMRTREEKSAGTCSAASRLRAGRVSSCAGVVRACAPCAATERMPDGNDGALGKSVLGAPRGLGWGEAVEMCRRRGVRACGEVMQEEVEDVACVVVPVIWFTDNESGQLPPEGNGK